MGGVGASVPEPPLRQQQEHQCQGEEHGLHDGTDHQGGRDRERVPGVERAVRLQGTHQFAREQGAEADRPRVIRKICRHHQRRRGKADRAHDELATAQRPHGAEEDDRIDKDGRKTGEEVAADAVEAQEPSQPESDRVGDEADGPERPEVAVGIGTRPLADGDLLGFLRTTQDVTGTL